MKILELFSGYGTASFALKRLAEQGIIDNYECVGYSDIDKYANQCFKQNHCTNDTEDKLRLGDVKLVNPNELEDFDLLTGGFPCQAFSVAGRGLGELDPRGTLFWEIVRIAEVKKPRYMLLENVKGLVSKKHKPTFDKILSELERIGYHVHWKVLNTKDYGIPQNRERVWFVCFKDKSEYDSFTWPEKEELKIFIKDILEEEVDEKYFLSELLQERFRKYLEAKNCVLNPYNKKQSDKIVGTIGTSVGGATSKTAQIVLTRNGYETNMSKQEIGEAHRIYGVNGVCPPLKRHEVKIYDRKGFDSREKFRESELSPTLSTKMGTGGNNVPMVIGKHQKDILQPLNGSSSTITSTMYKQPPMIQDVSSTLTTELAHSTGRDFFRTGQAEKIQRDCGRLRRLTPKECFRLQGFLNDEINLSNLSDTQCYKLAGNGQSVNVVEKIFKEMFK